VIEEFVKELDEEGERIKKELEQAQKFENFKVDYTKFNISAINFDEVDIVSIHSLPVF